MNKAKKGREESKKRKEGKWKGVRLLECYPKVPITS